MNGFDLLSENGKYILVLYYNILFSTIRVRVNNHIIVNELFFIFSPRLRVSLITQRLSSYIIKYETFRYVGHTVSRNEFHTRVAVIIVQLNTFYIVCVRVQGINYNKFYDIYKTNGLRESSAFMSVHYFHDTYNILI